MDYVGSYLKWLKSEMSQDIIQNNIVQLTTPFVDRHNDYTQIYIIEENNRYKISDDAYTLTDLSISGLDLFASPRRQAILNATIARHGVQIDKKTEELYVNVSKDRLSEGQHRLLQCMLDINDLFYLATPSIRSLFLEDVTTFFDSHNIYYVKNLSVIGETGFAQTYDFILQNSPHQPERFIKVMNQPSKDNAERFLFSWIDTQKTRSSNSQFIPIINDSKKKVSSDIWDAFAIYDVHPVQWSDMTKNIARFS